MLTNPQLNCKTLGRHYIRFFLASAFLPYGLLLTPLKTNEPLENPSGPHSQFPNQESYTTQLTAEVGLAESVSPADARDACSRQRGSTRWNA